MENETLNETYITHDEKINYLKIAAGICNFGFSPLQLDLLVSLYELILEKKSDATIDDILFVKQNVECLYDHKGNKFQNITNGPNNA